MELGALWRAVKASTVCRLAGHAWQQHMLNYPSGRVEFAHWCKRCLDFRAPGK